MLLYRIIDWDYYYENSRSRQIKDCNWVPIPNKQAGLGYKKLVTGHKNGAAHYGAWVAIVLRCSQQAHREGFLTDGGFEDNPPWTVEDLALVTSINEAVLDEALPRFIEIGWMQVTQLQEDATTLPQGNGLLPQPEGSLPPNRTEQKGTEQNRIKSFDQSEFDRFWTSYPRKVGKAKCLAWFKAHKPDNVDQMIETVNKFKECDQWQDSSLIPHPYTWLNRGGWDDEIGDVKRDFVAEAIARRDAKNG